MTAISNLIYFDNNATTRMDERVAEVMQAARDKEPGQQAAESAALMSKVIHCRPEELFFTTGITPAIHLALENSFDAYRHLGNHIITSEIEHGEVLKAIKHLQSKGAEVTYLGVDKEGLIDVEALEAAIRPETSMVCIMTANNHTGVIQPVEKISEACKRHGLFFFSDASQFVGKMRCDVTEQGMDCLVFGSHKMHGPKEIGVIYAKAGTLLYQKLKADYKSTIIDPVLMTGFAKATEVFERDHWDNSAHISKLKNYFEHQLLDMDGLRINGSTRHRLYNTSNLTFPPHKHIASLAGRFKFLSYNAEIFYVLRAMGLADDEIPNTFRFSFGKYNTLEEVQSLVAAIMEL